MNYDITNIIKKPYKHLNKEDRIKIEILYSQNKSCTYIANFIGFHKSTISRELRNRIKSKINIRLGTIKNLPYSAQSAHNDYIYKRSFSKCSYIVERFPILKKYIEDKILIDKWMPDTISNYINKHELYLLDGMTSISTPSIYLAIRNNILDVQLKNMRRMKLNKEKRLSYKHLVPISKKDYSIELRPEYINNRQEYGHFEIDTIIGKKKGKQACLLTLTERKTRYEIIRKLNTKSKEEVTNALIDILNQYPHIKSLTTDNGSEFSGFKDVISKTNIKFYFCHPYASCEKGTNEKHNSLIRYFIKKGTSIDNYTQEDLNKISIWMNNYPRKILKWNTPSEMFHQELLLI